MTDGTTYYNKDSGIYIGDCSDYTGCNATIKIAKIELYTAVEYEHDKNSDGEKITVWGMEQQGKMLPGDDNNDWNGSDCDYEDRCHNYRCHLDQNWRRSDLTNLQNAKYAPSTDKTAEINTTYTVGTGGVSVSASADYPKIERDMDYQSDDYLNGTYHFYWGDNYNDFYEGAHYDSLLGQVSTWTSDRPSDGDNIAPTYQLGAFTTINCSGEHANYSTDLFTMFTWPIS